MDDFTIQVTPELLAVASENIAGYVEIIRRACRDMQEKIKQTESFWTGEAGNQQRTLFSKQNPEMEQLVGRFSDQAAKLQEIARTYTSARQGVNAAVMDLPVDAIE